MSGVYGATPYGALSESGVTVEISETMALTSPITVQEIARITEALNVAPTFELSEVYALSEYFALTTTSSGLAIKLATISEALGVNHTLRPVMQAILSDSFDLDDGLTEQAVKIASLIDSLVLSGAATSTVIAMAMISEAMALVSVASSIQEGTIDEAMDLAETIEARLIAMETIVATAAFTDTATGLAMVSVEVDESFVLTDTATGLATLTAAINDGLRFSVGFVFDDTPIIALSMNAATKGLSTYSQYPFNSMTEFNGTYYGAADGGLYSLDGATDDGEEIVWRIRTGMSNLGTGRNKAMDAAYLGLTATGRVALKCIVVEPRTGEKIVHWYELTETAAVTPRGRRLLVGRGLRSVYWGFEMTNVTAGDIELDVVELHPIVLEGRLP